MQKIKNYCFFSIRGLNQERFFNELAKICCIFDVNRYEKNKTSFKVPLKYYKKVKNLILLYGFEIIGYKKKGFIYNFLNIRFRYGLLAGVFLFIVFYCFQLPFIWQIKINGVDDNLKRDISVYVANNFTNKKSDINCKQIEVAIRNEFDNLSFASVAIVGQSIVVNAKEGVDPNEKTGNFEAITADLDCKIVNIKLIQGTLAVESGDAIRAGDVIVFPYIIDSYGQEKKVEPKAEILVECWIKGEETHINEEIIRQRTGNYIIQNKLYLFGAELYSHNSNVPYNDYEIEESERYFSNNNVLPFIYKKTICYETEFVSIKQDYQNVRENKINSAREKALQKIGECDIITEERYVENNLNGVYNITYYLTVQKEILIK